MTDKEKNIEKIREYLIKKKYMTKDGNLQEACNMYLINVSLGLLKKEKKNKS